MRAKNIQNIIDHEFNWGKDTADKMCKHNCQIFKGDGCSTILPEFYKQSYDLPPSKDLL